MPDDPASDFIDLRFDAERLAALDLPDVPYPLRRDALPEVLAAGGELPLAHLLHGLQQRSSRAEDWQALEPAMRRLAALIAPPEPRAVVDGESEEWYLECGPVDLTGEVVTIQRGDHLLAGLQPRPDGRLRAASYRPLDADALSRMLMLAVHPSRGQVCLRANNWEYAKDAACGLGQFYRFERGASYFSYWQHGVGLDAQRQPMDGWTAQRALEAVPAVHTLVQVGVYYSLAPAD